MKFPSTTFALITVSTLMLCACGGGDKPAEPTQPTDVKSAQVNTPAPEPDTTNTTEEATPPADTPADVKQAKDDTPKVASTPNQETPTQPDTTPVQALSIEEGKKRYETTCRVCHDQGLLDAPKLTDKANWAKRLEKGVDTLHTHSAKGFGKMPAQAVDDVSEAEVYAAVDYIISQVK